MTKSPFRMFIPQDHSCWVIGTGLYSVGLMWLFSLTVDIFARFLYD